LIEFAIPKSVSTISATILVARIAVVVTTGYGLDGRVVGIRFLTGTRFSLHQRVLSALETHPTCYPMGMGTLSLELKLSEHKTDNSPESSAEVDTAWVFTATPSHVFMA
jgi:hypothetical protein